MEFKLSKFTVRIDSELLKKFRYVAEYNARSANREIEVRIALIDYRASPFKATLKKIKPETYISNFISIKYACRRPESNRYDVATTGF